MYILQTRCYYGNMLYMNILQTRCYYGNMLYMNILQTRCYYGNMLCNIYLECMLHVYKPDVTMVTCYITYTWSVCYMLRFTNPMLLW